MDDHNFPGSDPKMVEFSAEYRLLTMQNIADFSAFDPDFDAEFIEDWRLANNASIAVPTAEYRQDVGQGLTERVNQTMVLGRQAYRKCKYFVLKAYPNDRSMQNRFAFDNYLESSRSQSDMVFVLSELYTTASEPAIKAALLAKGYKQEDIDQLNTLGGQLDTYNAEQNVFIGDSPVATAARRATHGHTWSFVASVNAASKIVYMNNYVMLNRFLLPASAEPQEVLNFLGTVRDAEGNPIAGADIKIAALTLAHITDINGKYGFTELPAGTYMVDYAAPGFAPRSESVVVPATGSVTVDVQLSPLP